MKGMKTLLTAVFITALLGSMAMAAEGTAQQAYAQPPALHWHESDSDFLKAFHNPMEGVTMGLDIRLREMYGRNILTTNERAGDNFPVAEFQGNYNNYHWQRYRTRWSLSWAMTEDVTFNTRLTWEFWGHCAPDQSVPTRKLSPFFDEKNYDFDEAIFDIMNIQWRNVGDMPLTLTLGRQEIILGTGWLVLDGTPGDGSRTIFFDAIRAQYDLSECSKLDLIYIQQYDNEDEYIKPFNHGAVRDRRNLTQSQDERGVILYLTNKLSDMTSLEGYYIYKEERQSELNKWWINKGYSTNGGDDAEVHTFGGRLYGNLNDNWSYSAEAAAQFGKSHYFEERYRDLCAQGANTKLMYAFNDEKKNELHVGYEYLSGDDDSTDGVDERFNPLWGDWPQYQRGGDLQSYLWAFESEGLGNVSNLHRFGVGHSFKPNNVWTIATDYNLFWADENSTVGNPPPDTLVLSESGKFRGHMLSGIATYSCCKKFKTHFMLDYFIPGGYYESPSGTESFFARVNLEWSF